MRQEDVIRSPLVKSPSDIIIIVLQQQQQQQVLLWAKPWPKEII